MTLGKLAVAGAICAALAVGLPQARAQEPDPRLVTVVYDATRIVRINGRPGVQATIAFGDDEKIENVAVGDSDKWQITPNKRANLLFARPLDPAAVTNMTVVTDKRTYLFDLVASLKERPVYMLHFTYNDIAPAPAATAIASAAPPPVLAAAPQEAPAPTPRAAERKRPRAARAEPPQPALSENPLAELPPAPQPLLAEAPPPPPPTPLPQPALTEPLPPTTPAMAYRSAIDEAVGAPADDLVLGRTGLRAEADRPGDPAFGPPTASEPGALNFAWIRKGKETLLPLRAYDDGRATYLIWGSKQSIPDVQVIGAQGEQASPQVTRNGNSLVIAAVPSQIVLRAGPAWATLDNFRLARSSGAPAGATE